MHGVRCGPAPRLRSCRTPPPTCGGTSARHPLVAGPARRAPRQPRRLCPPARASPPSLSSVAHPPPCGTVLALMERGGGPALVGGAPQRRRSLPARAVFPSASRRTARRGRDGRQGAAQRPGRGTKGQTLGTGTAAVAVCRQSRVDLGGDGTPPGTAAWPIRQGVARERRAHCRQAVALSLWPIHPTALQL